MSKAILINNNPVNVIGIRVDAETGSVFLATTSGWESHYPTLDEAKQACNAAGNVQASKARAAAASMTLLDQLVAQPVAPPIQPVAQPPVQ